MVITLRRLHNGRNSTLGILSIGGSTYFTLEDEFREEKVKGKTRIPAGKYEIKQRKEPSPMTNKYRQSFEWFDWHLQLLDVPNFNYIYIHSGNSHEHTDGCVLVGMDAHKMGHDWRITKSRLAFEEIYRKIRTLLRHGERVFIEVTSV